MSLAWISSLLRKWSLLVSCLVNRSNLCDNGEVLLPIMRTDHRPSLSNCSQYILIHPCKGVQENNSIRMKHEYFRILSGLLVQSCHHGISLRNYLNLSKGWKCKNLILSLNLVRLDLMAFGIFRIKSFTEWEKNFLANPREDGKLLLLSHNTCYYLVVPSSDLMRESFHIYVHRNLDPSRSSDPPRNSKCQAEPL